MYPPASPSLSHFAQAYVSGLLLSHRKTPHAMWDEGFLPYSPSRASALLGQDPYPYEQTLPTRLQKAPRNPYLAVDLMVSPHTGPRVQGLGRVYHTGRKAPVWGHLFLSLTLVYPHGDPYPLALKPFPTPGMGTPLYPQKTPSEALLDEVFDLLALEPGLSLKAVVADAQFSGGLTLRSLLREGEEPGPFLAASSHGELVVRALHAVREVREACPGMAWRHAWRVAETAY